MTKRSGIAGAREIVRRRGAKVVLLPAAALATMGTGGWIAGSPAAPGWALAEFAALATLASLDLLLRRPARQARPARARADDRRRRGGAPGRD